MVINNGFIVCCGDTGLPTNYHINVTFPISFNGSNNYKCMCIASLKSDDTISLIMGTSGRTSSTITFNTNRQSAPSGFYLAAGF